MKASLSRSLWLALFATASAQASYYAVFNGAYEMQPNSRYATAFTDNGLAAPATATTAMGIRLGNEGGGGLVRLAITAMDTLNLKAISGTSFGEVSWSRWGGLLQINLSPSSVFALTIGTELGMGFTKLLILTATDDGVVYGKHGFVNPIVGFEARLSPDFRFFVEAAYPIPFSITSDARGDALGAGAVARSHLALNAGLSFYFSL